MQKSHMVNITQETGTHAYLYKNQLFSKMTHTRFLATHNSLCNNQTHVIIEAAVTAREERENERRKETTRLSLQEKK